jgi:integrase
VPHASRRLKNEGSRRRVPVHPELVRAGFLEYVKGLPADGLVFPELKPGPHGKLTGAYSKWWARFTDDLDITDRTKTFHSLRGGFKDACRAVGMPEEVHDSLTGHTTGSVGRTYGRGVPLSVLAEWVGRVRYRGL